MRSNELYEAIKNLPPDHAKAYTAIIDIKVSEDVQAIFSKMEAKMEMLFEKTNSRIDHLEREMLTLHQSTNQRINYLLAAIGIVGTLVMSVITPLVLHFLNK